jgi:hypothetical protein
MPFRSRDRTPPNAVTATTAESPDASALDPDELDAIELPDRQALSMFTGGVGHLRVEPIPPVELDQPPVDPTAET